MEYDPVKKMIKTIDKTEGSPKEYYMEAAWKNMKTFAKQGRICQIDLETGEEDSYENFLNRIVRLATFMKEMGIKPGDIISTCTDNHLNSYIPILAARFIGAILASTDPSQSFDDTKHLINLVKPKMFFVGKGSEEMIEKCIENLGISCQIVPFVSYGEYVSFPEIMIKYQDFFEDFIPYKCVEKNSPSIIFFTSGTTGMPKAALYSSMKIINEGTNLPRKRIFGVSGNYWSSAIHILVMACTKGSTILITNHFDPETFWDTVVEKKVNVVVLSYIRTMEAVKYLKKPIENLYHFSIRGGQLPHNYLKELKHKLPNCNFENAYGSTEIQAVTDFPECTKPNSAGIPTLNGQTIKVVDPDTEETKGFNEIGEIRVKSNHQFLGYFGQDSEMCWDFEGFYKTGDMGYYDEDFNIFIDHRIADAFKYKNWHVSPMVIENVLCQHESVLMAFAFGVPHEKDGNHIKAVAILKENSTVSEEDLLIYANERLDDLNQIRAGVKIISKDSLPFTPTEKVKRHLLRDMN